MSDKLTESAPRDVWLQADAEAAHGTPRDPLHDWSDASWCASSVGGHEVRYIRRDLHLAALKQLRKRIATLQAQLREKTP